MQIKCSITDISFIFCPICQSEWSVYHVSDNLSITIVIITVRKRSCGKVMFLHLSCQSFCSQGRACVSQHAVGRGCTPPRQRHSLVFKKNLPFSQQIRHLTTNMFLLLSICHSRTNVFIHHFLLSRIYPFCPSVIPVLTCVSTGRRRRRMCRGSPRITSLLRLRVIRPTLRTDAPQSKGPFTYTIYSTTAIAKIKR